MTELWKFHLEDGEKTCHDKYFSPHEKRLEAQNADLKAKVETGKKQIDVKTARIKNLKPGSKG